MSLEEVQSKITAAEVMAARAPGSARLIAVSKMQPPERVVAVLEQGHRLFGENRVQEALAKWPVWQERYGGTDVHLLGPLQTNKARQAIEAFGAIHSLDRPKLADTLARLAQDLGRCPDLFVQVNTGDEAQKAGITPGEADAFIAYARKLDLPVIGVMCIPPASKDPSPHFALLANVAKRNGLANLSMGMSGDFEKAVAFGATHVRVGSAIFGTRS